jgi:hypothetical protein
MAILKWSADLSQREMRERTAVRVSARSAGAGRRLNSAARVVLPDPEACRGCADPG